MISNTPNLARIAVEHRASKLLFAAVVCAAAVPFAGWTSPLIWLALTAAATGAEHLQALGRPGDAASPTARYSVWSLVQNALYAAAALYRNRSAPPFGQAGIGEGGAPRLALATAFSIKPHGSCCRRRQVSMTLRMAA